MTKTNFTKAEEALSDTLQKITIEKLLEEAPSRSNGHDQAKTDSKRLAQEIQTQQRFLIALKRDLQRLWKRNPSIYKQVGMTRKELDAFMQISEKHSDQVWQKLLLIRSQVDKLLKSLPKNEEITSDDTLLKQQRKRHQTKRFNVNEKWLPLA